jgi:hypothetical protein
MISLARKWRKYVLSCIVRWSACWSARRVFVKEQDGILPAFLVYIIFIVSLYLSALQHFIVMQKKYRSFVILTVIYAVTD